MSEANPESVNKPVNNEPNKMWIKFPTGYQQPPKQAIHNLVDKHMNVRMVLTEDRRLLGRVLGEFWYMRGAWARATGQTKRHNPWPEVACNNLGLAVRDCWNSGWDDADTHYSKVKGQ